MKSKFQSLKINSFQHFSFKFIDFFELKQKNKTESNYCFYQFVFASNYMKYNVFKEILNIKIDLLKCVQFSFNKRTDVKNLKTYYLCFLNKKKIFTEYIFEFYFLKFFLVKDFFKINLIGNKNVLNNISLFPSLNLSKLTKVETPLTYPFTNTFLRTSLKKSKSEKLFEIFPEIFIRSNTLKFYFKEIDFLYNKISFKLITSNTLKKKIKNTKKLYENLRKTNFPLNYYFELQNEINKLTNYLGFKKQKTIEFLFFKFRNFQLKYIINILQVHFLEMYVTCRDKTKFKASPLKWIKPRQTNFPISQHKLLNSGIKSILFNLEFLFSKNFLYKSFSVSTIQHFYYAGTLKSLLKELKMPSFAFIEFIKQITGKTNFFSNKKQNLFLLKSQKQNYFFSAGNDCSLLLINSLFGQLDLIYIHFQTVRNFDPFSFIKFEFDLFFSVIKSLNNFELFFLQILSNNQVNLFLLGSTYFNKQLVEIYFFKKLLKIDLFLLKRLKTTDVKNYPNLLFVENNPLMLKYQYINFFLMNPKNKNTDTFNSLQFSYFYKLKKIQKNVLLFKLSSNYSNRVIYLEKTKVELIILLNENLKIFKSLNLIKRIQFWFSSLSNFVNLDPDIYFYYFNKKSSSDSFQFYEFGFQKNLTKRNEFIFIYRNYLLMPFNFKIIMKLPLKSNQELYLISLKKICKHYSNKNQNLLIRTLSEKLYVWVYFYRFLLIKRYFLELDHQLFRFLWKWSIRRHNNKSKNWIKTKYFFRINQKYLIFGIYINQNKSFKKVFQTSSFLYLPSHLQLFLNFNKLN